MALESPEFIPTKPYTFEKLRELMAMLPIAQGVMGSFDFQVVPREASPNMSVDVLTGDVWVRGASVARQGLYHTNNTSRANILVPGASGTNPRVDQVIIAIHDSSVIGSSDIPELRVVEGTASAGTQITSALAPKYRLGARSDAEIRALHPNFVRLADVLVRQSATDVKTSDIIDRRPWARGAYAAGQIASPYKVRLELAENTCRMSIWSPSPAEAYFVDVNVNGSPFIAESGSQQGARVIPFFLTAGSYLFEFKVTGGDHIVPRGAFIVVEELVRQNSGNGIT